MQQNFKFMSVAGGLTILKGFPLWDDPGRSKKSDVKIAFYILGAYAESRQLAEGWKRLRPSCRTDGTYFRVE